MKRHPLTATLVFGLSLLASVAHAQQTDPNNPAVTFKVTHSIPQSDPNMSDGGSIVGLVAGGGPSSTHTISVRWEVDVTYTTNNPDDLPDSFIVSYTLTEHGEGKVRLAGMTPPQGGGHGRGTVGRALGDTGTVQRQTTAVEAHVTDDPTPENLFKPVNSTTGAWTKTGNNTYQQTIILETDGQSCFAATNPLIQGSSTGLDGEPGSTTAPGPVPGDGASGQTWQICNVSTVGAGKGTAG